MNPIKRIGFFIPLVISIISGLWVFQNSCRNKTESDGRKWQQGVMSKNFPFKKGGLNPCAFIINRGQWDPRVHFLAHMPGVDAFLEDHGWTMILKEPRPARKTKKPVGFDLGKALKKNESIPHPAPLKGAPIRMTFVGGASKPEIIPGKRVDECFNFFLGNDPSRWKTKVPRFDSVIYKNLFPGIDVKVYPNAGRFEYDIVVFPWADLFKLVIKVDGAKSLKIGKNKQLVIDTGLGSIEQPPPVAWIRYKNGKKEKIKCNYRLLGKNIFGFWVKGWKGKGILTLDPILETGTYLGGVNFEDPRKLEVFNGKGKEGILITGSSSSFNFPVTSQAFQSKYLGNQDIVITKLSSDGKNLLFSTFIGGKGWEYPGYQKIDCKGNIVIIGQTNSLDFPTTFGAYQRKFGGKNDYFVFKINSQGDKLAFSTFLGGKNDETLQYNVTFQNDQYIILSGLTKSIDYPVTKGALQAKNSGGLDLVVSRIGFDGKVDFSTYFGGESDEFYQIQKYKNKMIYIIGLTRSKRFPISAGAFQKNNKGGADYFILKISEDGKKVIYSTYLGGSLDEGLFPFGDVDSFGNILVAGLTSSPDFPLFNSFQSKYGGGNFDIFLAKFDKFGNVVFSTFLGGEKSEDFGHGIFVNQKNSSFTVLGNTNSQNFPTTRNAFQVLNKGRKDIFISRFDSKGKILSSTLFGGSGEDYPTGYTENCDSSIWVYGSSNSPDLPTNNLSIQPKYGGGSGDCFVARFDKALSKMEYCSYFGGGKFVGPPPSGGEVFDFFSVDNGGIVTIVGETMSFDFPTSPGAFQTKFGGGSQIDRDLFLIKMDPKGQLLYSTLFGGNGKEYVPDPNQNYIFLESNGVLNLLFSTSSFNLHTSKGAFQCFNGGNKDFFFCRLDLLPNGVYRMGSSARSCKGPVSLLPTCWPKAGESKFGVLVTNAPKNSFGYLLLGLKSLKQGFPLLGVNLYLDPSRPIFLVPLHSDSRGVSRVPLPLPPWKGMKFAVQTIWAENQVCPGGKPLCSSWGLEVTTQ